jgi:hypothetical protein
MTTGVKIALGIAIAVALGTAGFYGFKDGKEATQEENVTSTQPSTESQTGKKIAFDQLAQQKGTHKCTVNQHVGEITTKGTVYMDKGFLRGEFAADYSGQKVNVYFIMRDGFTYTWNSMMPTQGFKIKNDTTVQVADTKAGVSGNITANTSNGYLDQIGDYQCEDWTADQTLFTLPTNITFKATN